MTFEKFPSIADGRAVNLIELAPSVRNVLKDFVFDEENRDKFGFHELGWLPIGKYKNKYIFYGKLEVFETSSACAVFCLCVHCGSVDVVKYYDNTDIGYDAVVFANIAIVPAYKYLPELVAEVIEELELRFK